jgi:putative membrane protein
VDQSKIRGLTIVGLPRGAELHVMTTGLNAEEIHVLPACPRATVEAVASDVLGDAEAVIGPLVTHGRRRVSARTSSTCSWRCSSSPRPPGALAGFRSRPSQPDPPTGRDHRRDPARGGRCRDVVAPRRAPDHRPLPRQWLWDAHPEREVPELTGIVGWRMHQSLWDRSYGLAHVAAATAAGEEQAVVVHDIPVGDAIALAAAAIPHTREEFCQPSTRLIE